MKDRIVGFLRGPDLVEDEWLAIAYVTDGKGDFWEEAMHYKAFADYLGDLENIREDGYAEVWEYGDEDEEVEEEEFDGRLDYEL